MRSYLFATAAALLAMSLVSCIVVRDPHGPQVYEPVHHDHYFEYYYYPTLGVYYDIHTHYYFHLTPRGWVKVRRLPPGLSVHGAPFHRLRMKEDRPYVRHEEHKHQYPPQRGDRRHDTKGKPYQNPKGDKGGRGDKNDKGGKSGRGDKNNKGGKSDKGDSQHGSKNGKAKQNRSKDETDEENRPDKGKGRGKDKGRYSD